MLQKIIGAKWLDFLLNYTFVKLNLNNASYLQNLWGKNTENGMS